MFMVVFGWFLAITGVIFLLSPRRGRRKVLKVLFRKLRWVLVIGIAYTGVALWHVAWENVGLTPKLLAGAGMLGMVWLFFFLKKQMLEKLSEWIDRIPGIVLRLAALVQIGIGTVMIIWRKLPWS